MKKSNNHIFIEKDTPEAFVLVEIGKANQSVVCQHTFYLSNRGFENPNARIALVYQEESITTIELDDGEKHIGILGTWSIGDRITHKFTCLDGLSPVFGRAVTRKAEK